MANNCYHPEGGQGTKKIKSDAQSIGNRVGKELINKRQSSAEQLKPGLKPKTAGK